MRDPQRERHVNFEDRWILLLCTEVLAVGELDEFTAAPWDMERFLRLIYDHWRHMESRLTLFASISGLDTFQARTTSRLRDGRNTVIAPSGRDMGPYRDWDEIEP